MCTPPPTGVLGCFHSGKQLFTKVLILSVLQNSACSQVNQGCTDVLLKEHLMTVLRCLSAHTRLLISHSILIWPLFDDSFCHPLCLHLAIGPTAGAETCNLGVII